MASSYSFPAACLRKVGACSDGKANKISEELLVAAAEELWRKCMAFFENGCFQK